MVQNDNISFDTFMKNEMRKEIKSMPFYKIGKRYFYILFNYRTEHIKFGISKNPTERCKKIALSSGQDIVVIYCLKTIYARIFESFCKNMFSENKIKGEWFHLQKYDVIRLISYIGKFTLTFEAEKSNQKPLMTTFFTNEDILNLFMNHYE